MLSCYESSAAYFRCMLFEIMLLTSKSAKKLILECTTIQIVSVTLGTPTHKETMKPCTAFLLTAGILW